MTQILCPRYKKKCIMINALTGLYSKGLAALSPKRKKIRKIIWLYIHFIICLQKQIAGSYLVGLLCLTWELVTLSALSYKYKIYITQKSCIWFLFTCIFQSFVFGFLNNFACFLFSCRMLLFSVLEVHFFAYCDRHLHNCTTLPFCAFITYESKHYIMTVPECTANTFSSCV